MFLHLIPKCLLPRKSTESYKRLHLQAQLGVSPRHYRDSKGCHRDSKGCPRDSDWACSIALLLLLLKASVPRLPEARLHHSTSAEIIPLSALMYAKSPQSCLTLCDPMDCSPPGSSAHGILQARILEWLPLLLQEIFPARGSNSRLLHLLHCQEGSLPLVPPGKSPVQ